MNKKDILELKKRLKKGNCTFTKMCGCYVNGEKNIILNFRETFLNLEEDEFFKYLDIAKKVLSGTVGNNILELNFPMGKDGLLEKQASLIALKKSQLKDDALLNSFYQSIIDSYDYEGNFLILVFHDAYDIVTKTTDNNKLDESEEVYEYILCAICPVSLSKAGLRYFENDNRIGSRIRDWVVEMPSIGFVFPAFIDRSADVNSVMYYTKNAKDPHPEIMEETLGCNSIRTATEQKEAFNTIIRKAVGADEKKSDCIFMDIQESLNNLIDEHNSMYENDNEPIMLTNNTIQDILIENGISEEITTKIEKSYNEEFGDKPPVADHLIDSKALAANEQRKKEERLENKVKILQDELQKTKLKAAKELENLNETNTTLDSEIASDTENSSSNDIILQVNPEKIPRIKSQIIDGKKYLVIPVDENELATVNGVNTEI